MTKKHNKFAITVALVMLLLVGAVFLLGESSRTLSGEVFMSKYLSSQNSVLLDVRTPREYNDGHIEGSINVDYENASFSEEIKKLDSSKTYFVYCRSGNRSGNAIKDMRTVGIKDMYELRGGIIANMSALQLVSGISNEVSYVVDESDMLDNKSLVSSSAKLALSDNEIRGLIQMREEEKLARDVYTTLGALWSVRTFSNIAVSEQVHTNAVKALLTTYNIKDPVADDAVGVFASKQMQELYNTLTAQGKVSSQEALRVGALIEDLDIYDLEVLKSQTKNEDILLTYNNLQKGSRNHMRAFVRSLGGNYTPKYISKNDYEAIISAPQERGRN